LVRACANVGSAYYNADGRIFRCAGTSCESAAEDVVSYCASRQSTLAGCNIAPGGGRWPSREGKGVPVAFGVLGLVVALRRRRWMAALAVLGLAVMMGVGCAPIEGDAPVVQEVAAPFDRRTAPLATDLAHQPDLVNEATRPLANVTNALVNVGRARGVTVSVPPMEVPSVARSVSAPAPDAIRSGCDGVSTTH